MNFLECILKQERKRAENFGVLNKSGEWRDIGVVFVHTAVFERTRN